MGEEYYIGLDVGTNSIGWAVTDSNYKLSRIKGKNAWGVRLFEEGKDASKRRAFRSARRRKARRNYRLKLLRSIFENDIAKVDPGFFLRLQESNLHVEDKSESASTPYALFNSKAVTKEYYKHFPTIWHLRKALMEGDEYALSDIRFIYLAYSHILKYRGNFLAQGDMSFDHIALPATLLNEIKNCFEQLFGEEMGEESENEHPKLSNFSLDDLLDVIRDDDLGVKAKTDKLKKIVICETLDKNTKYAKCIEMFCKLICGGKYNLQNLNDNEEAEKKELSFSGSFEDEKLDEIRAYLNDDGIIALVVYAKQIYDHVALERLLNNHDSLSSSFVSVYESHKKNLAELENVIKELDILSGKDSKSDNSLFFDVFRNGDHDSYNRLVNSSKDSKSRIKLENFHKTVKERLEASLKSNEDMETTLRSRIESILKEISKDNSDYLSIISHKSTSAIPHQFHFNELRLIYSKASEKYPNIFNAEKFEKLETLFKWRIPYFYGPSTLESHKTSLNEKHSWIVRNSGYEHVTMTPWNMKEIVNEEETKKAFMSNLTNHCEQVIGEPVLPSDSILYSDYETLNRINKIVINGSKIDIETKQYLFEVLFKKPSNETITAAAIKRQIAKKEGRAINEIALSGINKDDKFSVKGRFCFKDVFNFDDEKQLAIVEDIIYIMAVYKDMPEEGIKCIEDKYPDLTSLQKKKIRAFKAGNWGKFSRAFLKLRTCDDAGVFTDISALLYDTNDCLNEILFKEKYAYQDKLSQIKESYIKKNGLSDESLVDEIIESASPKTRRSTIQSLRIIDEIVSLRGGKAPDKITIEVTREDDIKNKNKIAKTRDKEIRELYKKFKEELRDYAVDKNELLNDLNSSGNNIKGQALYLYFKQMGLDLYTGERIKFEDVLDSTKYDIDHIVPKIKIKDDSIDNKVLTARYNNQNVKKDLYPLPLQFQQNQKARQLWKILLEKGAISEKKYNKLTRTSELTDDELEEFVNAQINSINISNIVLKKCLEIKYPSTTLIFSKAQYPSGVRQRYKIAKIRELNDVHHAVDAYLNIFCGVSLYNHFNRMDVIKARESEKKLSGSFSYNPDNHLDWLMCVEGKSEHADPDTGENMKPIGMTVVNTCWRKDQLLTYKVNYGESSFYDQTIYKKGNGDLVPCHTKDGNPLSNIDKYGGFSGKSNAGFIVKQGPKGVYLENVTTMDGFDKKKIIPIGQLVYSEGCHYLLWTNNKTVCKFKPLESLFLSKQTTRYLKSVISLIDRLSDDFVGNEFECFTDKNQNNRFVISKTGNEKCLRELIDAARLEKFKNISFLSKVIDFYNTEANLLAFRNSKLRPQIDLIKELISYFNREGFKQMRPTLQGISKWNVKVVYRSITGLLEHSIPLDKLV